MALRALSGDSPMPIPVQCPGCGRPFQAADRLAGKRAKCPHCQGPISVPAGAASSARVEAAWYVQTGDGAEHGPMSRAQLERLVSSGRLNCFCRVRHQTWSDWKWAEDLFPQLTELDQAASAGDDARRETAVKAPPGALSAASGAREPRVVTCPDCGNTVSTRARQCPHCGCPAAHLTEPTAAAQAASGVGDSLPSSAGREPTADRLADATLGAEPGGRASKWFAALVVGSAVLLLAVGVVGLGVGWWLWKGRDTAGPAGNVAPVAAPPPAPDAPAVSAEEMETVMQRVAAEVAKRLDGEFRTAHAAKTVIEQTRVSAELMQALAQGDLNAIPDSLPAELDADEGPAHESLHDSLYDECLAHLRANVTADEFSEQAVQDEARRWEEGRRAALETELMDELQKHVAPGRQPR